MPTHRDALLQFLRSLRYGVQSSSADDGAPQAAVVGFVVTDAFEIFFDTLGTTRKAANLRFDPRAAFTVWSGECTLQIEGDADEPRGAELDALLKHYFAAFPDGVERSRLPGIAYFRIRPRWIRRSDFGGAQPVIEEWRGEALRG